MLFRFLERHGHCPHGEECCFAHHPDELRFTVVLKEVFDCPARFYMVMELCCGGEMFDRIVKKSMYTEDEAR